MPASYPSALKTFTTKVNIVDTVDASHVNDLQLEVVAIETALGIDVNLDASNVNQGSVRTRLNSHDAALDAIEFPVELGFALSDEQTAITTGNGKLTVRAPLAFTITEVRASLTTASTLGQVTVNVRENGTSIFSTKPEIEVNEKTSTTAATQAVISDPDIADDSELRFDIDAQGTGAKGLKVWLIGTRSSA